MNNEISLTKIFTFDTAHALENYPGKCRNIHGHTYHLHVTVNGSINNKINDPYEGMIIDFVDLKKWVKNEVIDFFDHSLVLYEKGKLAELLLKDTSMKLLCVSYQPTCENMLIDIKNRLKNSILDGLILKKLILYETPTSYAEWNS